MSVNHQMSGFVPMQGAGAHRGVSIPLVGDDVVGLWQDESAVADVTGLAGVLGAPRAEAWTGVTITAKTPASDLDLWLATTLPGFCLITAKQEAIDDGTVNLPWQYGTPALVDGPNLAYRAKPRPADGTEGVYEFGAVAPRSRRRPGRPAAGRADPRVGRFGSAVAAPGGPARRDPRR